jgi:hypothetical protein
MIRLVHIEDFLSPAVGRAIEEVEFNAGAIAGDFRPIGFDGEIGYIIGGERVEADHALSDGDELIVVKSPHWVSFFFFLVKLAIVYFVAKLLMPDPDSPRGDNIEGLSGVSNTWGEGRGVPIVYGTRRTGGHVIGYYNRTTNIDVGQEAHMVLAVSEGEIWEVLGNMSEAMTRPAMALGSTGLAYLGDIDAFNYSSVGWGKTHGSATPPPDQMHGNGGVAIQSSVGQNPTNVTTLSLSTKPNDKDIVVLNSTGFSVNDIVYRNWSPVYLAAHGSRGVVRAVDYTNKQMRVDWDDIGQTTRGDSITKSGAIISTSLGAGNECHQVSFNLHFPSGLFLVNDSGEYRATTASFRIWRKMPAATSWALLPQSELIGDAITVERATSFWHTIDWQPTTLEADQEWDWKIEHRQLDVTTTPTNLDDERLNGSNAVTLHSVVRWGAAGMYPRRPHTACVGLNGLPTASLNGQLPPVTVKVVGVKVPHIAKIVRDYYFLEPEEERASNPAWVLADFLRRNRYGAGEFVKDTDLDLQSFWEWGAWCDEEVAHGLATDKTAADCGNGVSYDSVSYADKVILAAGAGDDYSNGESLHIAYGSEDFLEIRTIATIDTGVTITGLVGVFDVINLTSGMNFTHVIGTVVTLVEARHKCDIVISKDETFWDVAQAIAQSGRANLVKTGTKYRIVYDHERDPVQLFSEANIVGGSWSHTTSALADSHNVVEATYYDESALWNRKVARVIDDASVQSGDPMLRRTLNLRGVTRRSAAYRDASYWLHKGRLQRTTVTFEAGLDAIACEVGDLIVVQHGALDGGKGCRITAANTQSITFDDDLVVSGEEAPLRLSFRLAVKDEAKVYYNSATLFSTHLRGNPLTMDSDMLDQGFTDWGELVGMPCAYGKPAEEMTKVSITQISTTDNLNRKIMGTVYDPLVFSIFGDMDVDKGGEDWSFDGDWTAWSDEAWDGTWEGGFGEQPLSAPSYADDGTMQLEGSEVLTKSPRGDVIQRVQLGWRPPSLEGMGHSSRFSGKASALPVKHYELYGREKDIAEDEASSSSWKFLAQTPQCGITLDSPASSTTWQFRVVPISWTGVSATVLDVAGIDVVLGNGAGGGASNGTIHIEPLPMPNATMRNVPFSSPQITVAPYSTSEQPDFYEVRLGGSWESGRFALRFGGGTAGVETLTPTSDDMIFVRAFSRAGLWSPVKVIEPSAWAGFAGAVEKVNSEEQGLVWPAVPVDGFTSDLGVLKFRSGELTGYYQSNSKDAGAPAAGERRAVWVAFNAKVFDSTLTAGDSSQLWKDNRRTFETSLYEDDAPVSFVAKVRWSDDAIAWSDWLEVDGALEATARYYQHRLEGVRLSTDWESEIDKLRIVIHGDA